MKLQKKEIAELHALVLRELQTLKAMRDIVSTQKDTRAMEKRMSEIQSLERKLRG